jgi:glycosyltransferase involved in cell wall biosynthesis
VLYICIPSYNEAPTVGVLLWRIRKVFQEFSREYEVLVFDDGSTDATAETLAPYRDVMPLTILGGSERKGYAVAVDGLCRAVAKRTRYPRRDAAIFLQADFTDQPEHIPELVKRFEGGADVVVVERPTAAPADGAAVPTLPVAVRRLGRVAPWLLKPFVSVPGVRDPFGSFRLYRIAVLRDLVRAAGGTRGVVVAGDPAAPSWGANAELLVNASAFARRVETVELAPRYDVRVRDTRIRPLADAMGLFRFARTARSRRLSPGAATVGARDATTPLPAGRDEGDVASPRQGEPPHRPPAEAPRHAEPRASGTRGGAGRRDAAATEASATSASTDEASPRAERTRSRRSRSKRAERPERSERAPRSADAAREEVATTSDDIAAAAGEQRPPRPRDRARRQRGEQSPEPAAPPTRTSAEPAEDAENEVAADSGSGSPAAATPADVEAQRQRQRARRKRSRQRRAARDAARGQSESSDDASPDSPASRGEAEGGASSSAERDEPRRDVAAQQQQQQSQSQPSSAATPVVQ